MESLTKNGIKFCFNLKIGDKPLAHEIDYNFQIVFLKLVRTDGDKSMYQCTLSDGDLKYGCFIFVKDKTTCEIGQNDIVKIKSLVHSLMSDKQSDTFIVKKYESVKKNAKLIGNPSIFSPLSPFQGNFSENQVSNVPKAEPQKDNGNGESTGRKEKKEPTYTLLENLHTYSSNFRIMVRVTQKSDIKPFRNGNGKIFCFNVIDKNGTEMPICAFNDIADRYFPIITEGRVYEIYSPKVKSNDKRYSTNKSDFRLNLEDFTSIKEVFDDGSVKQFNLQPVKLKDINNLPSDSYIDVIGFIYELNSKSKINTKLGEMDMRRLLIADDSECIVEVTLWKEHANRTDLQQDSVIALKNMRVKDFNGKKLSTADETTIYIEPIIDEATKLKDFKKRFEGEFLNINALFHGQGKGNQNGESINGLQEPLVPLREVLESIENDDLSGKIPFFKVKCYISKFEHDIRNVYPGCCECKRKVISDSYGWKCMSCDKTIYEPLYIYSFSVKIKDFSADTYLDVFSQCGEKIIEMTAKDYLELLNNRDKEAERLNKMASEIEMKQFFILVKVKANNYNNQIKKKFSAVKIDPIDKQTEANRLMSEIMSKLGN